jgi:RNA polymerase sigma factor (sigma-70 family)
MGDGCGGGTVDEPGPGEDGAELADLLRPLYAQLRRFAAVVGPVELDPDDLVQDAIVRFLATGYWRSIDDVQAYLRRTIVNLAANERRRLGRHRSAVSRERADPSTTASYPSDLDDLEHIEPQSRALLYLVEVEGASVNEAAAAVGCSSVAARARLSRARRRLRQALESEALDG